MEEGAAPLAGAVEGEFWSADKGWGWQNISSSWRITVGLRSRRRG